VAVYNLDVAFSSDVTPNNASLPVAMAYGFTNNADALGTFRGKGQTKETVPPGSTVSFVVYDTAPSPTYNVTSVQISAVNKAGGSITSPFSDSAWANGSITAVSNPSGPNQVQLNGPNSSAISTGCNVTGRSWIVGTFTVANLQGQQRFEITITVLTQNAQQSQKSFIVDPEVVVGQENR
jgi:hypothetical protein